MALFPKIQSPCPYVDRLSSIMDGDMCRVCKREVFDLTNMSDDERVSFMKGCAGEVCVSYKIPIRVAAAALVVAGSAMPMAAAACDDVTTIVVTGGGIKDSANAAYIQIPDNHRVSELPVIYEDKSGSTVQPAPAANASGTQAVPTADPVSLRAAS
jgi:predicted Fe-S protein YdhL (DUF1289 family)